MTADYTLDNFKDLYDPHIGARNATDPAYFREEIEKEIQRLLNVYERECPKLQEADLEVLKGVMEKAGIQPEEMEKIAAM